MRCRSPCGTVRCVRLGRLGSAVDRALERGEPEEMRSVLEQMRNQINALKQAERGPEGKMNSRDYVRDHFRQVLHDAGITSGRVAELGGPRNSFREEFPEYQFEFLSIFPDKRYPKVHVADITYCPQIPDESYDAIFSISVMEHVARPWAAAREIKRILKPGGVVYHAAPFSYFFHGAPMDFWRFTPSAFEQLFEDFEVLHASFYGANRRRNNMGSEANPVDKDGGQQFAVDAFGGWRENWTTLFAARKSQDAARRLNRRRIEQMAVDAVAMWRDRGVRGEEAYEKASDLLAWIRINAEGEPRRRSQPGHRMKPQKIRQLWRQRESLGLRPGPNRAALGALVEQLAGHT